MQEDLRHRPRFAPAEAVRIAHERYGLESTTAEELPSERDQNFKLSCRSGERFVLKIANADARRETLDCQNQAIRRVVLRAGPLCPAVCETTTAESIVEVPGNDGARHDVRLLTWLEGTPLAKVQPHTPELLRSLGALLGAVSEALVGFEHSAARRSFVWDLRHARDAIRERQACLADARQRDLIAWFVQRYESLVAERHATLRQSVLHNDANDYNVLVADRAFPAERVAGLIDFGDIVYSCTVHELAICLAYAMLGKREPLTAAANVTAGYHRVFPLTEDELAALFPLACLRLCQSVSMSAYQRARDPGNAYLSISETAAWDLLQRLRGADPEIAHAMLQRACTQLPARAANSAEDGVSRDELLARRQQVLGKALSVSYRSPLKIVSGRGQYLYDDAGREFLDCVNNVCHVGHCHPYVVAAATRQMAQLNTNTRYLHDTIVRYAERLTALLPDPLSVCFFVNSGSEANDLALRMARTCSGGADVIVVDGAYHGNLSSLIEISPYKFDGPGGSGAADFVHKAIMPDGFRGPFGYSDPEAGRKYAEDVRDKLDLIERSSRQVAAFICESLLSCGGQIVLPDGYLREVYGYVRGAGGVCIADEVQVGFGRVGSHFWGFETQGVVPDIVTLGKPIGNGHPLGAVVTTPAVADAFANGMEYFNTYGGNPVSCAVGLAVLDTIADEGLQEQAEAVGGRLQASLRRLMNAHSQIGDVRGLGMFLGVELVRDRVTLEPAADLARAVVEHAKDEGVLLSTDGPLHNVLKIKPPLSFTRENADRVVDVLDSALSECAD